MCVMGTFTTVLSTDTNIQSRNNYHYVIQIFVPGRNRNPQHIALQSMSQPPRHTCRHFFCILRLGNIWLRIKDFIIIIISLLNVLLEVMPSPFLVNWMSYLWNSKIIHIDISCAHTQRCLVKYHTYTYHIYLYVYKHSFDNIYVW